MAPPGPEPWSGAGSQAAAPGPASGLTAGFGLQGALRRRRGLRACGERPGGSLAARGARRAVGAGRAG